MNPPISTIYKNDDIDIDNYTQAIQDNEIDKENEGKTFEEVLTLLYSIHVKYVNELKTKYDHKLNYQKRITEYNVQQVELDNQKLKLKIEQLEKQIQYNEEEPLKYNMQKNNEMKIVFDKELKHWQQQYHILKKHFKNYQVKAKERIEQWKKYSEYIKSENQKLQNEIISKLPDISKNNFDVSMLIDISNEKEKSSVISNNNNKKVKIEDNNHSKVLPLLKKRKYSESCNDQDILSSPVIKTPSSKIIENLNIQNLQNNKNISDVKKEFDDEDTNMDNPYPRTPKNEFTTPRKRMNYFNNKNMNNYRQGTTHVSEIHPSSCTTVYDENDNNIRILSSPTPSQENQSKPSFMLINNFTSTPNKPSVASKDRLTKKLSTMSLKENINLNQEDLKNNEVEFIATTPEDEIKRKNNNDKIKNNPTSEFTVKPIQRQNSMVLTREQLKQMTKPKEKEKIHINKNLEEKNESPRKENNIETLDEDLKNIMIQGIDSNKSSDIEIVKINKENETTPENSTKKIKRRKNKKKKKNVLLSPSDRILKELCESSDIELNNKLDMNTDDDGNSDDDDDSDDDSQVSDEFNEEAYSNPLNSSQKSEEIIKNVKVGQALMNPDNQQQNEEDKEKSENAQDPKKTNKSSTSSKNTDSDKKKKKSKPKKKSRRRETIIPETPSAIRSDSSGQEGKYSKNKDEVPPGEKKVYIWKTNYQNTDNINNDDNQNPSFMFEDNDDLDISKEIKKISENAINVENNDNNNELLKSHDGNNEIINDDEKEQEKDIVKDHDITINDNDIDIIEVIKNVNNNDINNNTVKFKKTKQQTLYNYTNSRNEINSSPTNSSNEETTTSIKSIHLTPSKNLKLRKKKSEVLYNETVRQKYKRKQLHGTTCPCCQDFFTGVNKNDNNHNRIQEISRHRYNNIPKDTPEEYWDVNFPSSKPDSTP